MIGKKFYDANDKKCHVINTFIYDGKEIVTYKVWSKYNQRWYFISETMDKFLASKIKNK